MRYVRKIQGQTKKDRIRYHTIRIGLGTTPVKEKAELAP
jgi:hypothetical protein